LDQPDVSVYDPNTFCISQRSFAIGIAIAGLILMTAVVVAIMILVSKRRRKNLSTTGSSIYSGPYTNTAYSHSSMSRRSWRAWWWCSSTTWWWCSSTNPYQWKLTHSKEFCDVETFCRKNLPSRLGHNVIYHALSSLELFPRGWISYLPTFHCDTILCSYHVTTCLLGDHVSPRWPRDFSGDHWAPFSQQAYQCNSLKLSESWERLHCASKQGLVDTCQLKIRIL